MKEYYVVTFKNTHGAINGEKILKEQGIDVNIMPTPIVITKSCGISIKIDSKDIDTVKSLINEEKLTIKNIYERSSLGYKQICL
ncbi:MULTISPECIES: DUF3343 domain-containing protein [Clostridium]|uniref:DUF3343 domain-containing protein n=3 Tax=Clostridium TaxID=1485 RepID=A0A3M0SGY1_9CLOT|nr:MULTISPECIES: DUF3343 domain-containing protein [Clostridium]ADK17283.1 conserved hypothetical protein [Clostridium ljungdahlii DSM 13528]AGY76323.1 DUF3343 domain-containing protein [Clostridium autoethanogenum DSM 10061]ALU36485.1 hypothetical protein CLAU_2056 [Clostridium autoethanogenum DSM 10061]OAA84150.1 hypothetical protein WX45_01895 [Clostridium ljungdahlii DSM 13528]OVY48944.1 hypothetical protein WX72_00023 [Clostridium autoethanogenum]